MKTTFENIVRDQSVDICMYTVCPQPFRIKNCHLSPKSKPNNYAAVERIKWNYWYNKKVKQAQYSDLPSRVAHLVNNIDHAIDGMIQNALKWSMDNMEYKDGHQQHVLKITKGDYSVQCHIVESLLICVFFLAPRDQPATLKPASYPAPSRLPHGQPESLLCSPCWSKGYCH